MAKSKFFKIDLALSYIVSMLEVHGTILNRVERDGEHILFEIYGVDNMLALEKVFSPHVVSEQINIDIITNKSSVKKPLIFSASYYKTNSDSLPDMWEFRIYQKDSRGCVYNRFSTVDSLPQKLFDIIKPLDNDIQYNRKLRELDISFHKINSELEKNIFLLTLGDLQRQLNVSEIKKSAILGSSNPHAKVYLDSFIEKQIVYTYNYYNSIYDSNVERIDDGKQYNETVDNNKIIKPTIDLCLELASVYMILAIKKE
ncbi:MAG: hypothetical protein U9Q66_00605 [Patescibacteria group bacterium]|nr:hypothetical protein [Patescibacteria group bacterium]